MTEALWKSTKKEGERFVRLTITDPLFDELSKRNLIKFYEYQRCYIIQPYDENYHPIKINIGGQIKQEDFKIILEDRTEQQLFQ